MSGRTKWNNCKEYVLDKVGKELGFSENFLAAINKTAKVQLLVVCVMRVDPGSALPSKYSHHRVDN